MAEIRPFRIDIPQADLDDLQDRLSRTRWPERETVRDWSQGVPLDYVRELASYWAGDYDWRARERRLNRFDQFVTEIDGLDVHFIHRRSAHPNALPLVITHGWPGSVADSGYSKQQSTRPQTLGYGLADSPVGQLAWIVEKFRAWTDCDGHPENALTKDEMLDDVMLYWLTNSATSSARLYWESFGEVPPGRIEVPTGVAAFPKEIIKSPRNWCEQRYNITHWTDMPRGGHFAACEQPELFTEDVRAFFGTVRRSFTQ